MTTLTIELPDGLAERARREGLLTEQAIRALLEDATRVAAMKRLDNMWRAVPPEQQTDPPLSAEELQDIIRSVRVEHPVAHPDTTQAKDIPQDAGPRSHLLARLKTQPVVQSPTWSRADLYDDTP